MARALNHYLVTVAVRLHGLIRPSPSKEDPNPAALVGYFINIGVSAKTPEDALRTISAAIDDGIIEPDKAEFKRVGVDEIHSDILRRFESSEKLGIWYRSGRVLFPSDREAA